VTLPPGRAIRPPRQRPLAGSAARRVSGSHDGDTSAVCACATFRFAAGCHRLFGLLTAIAYGQGGELALQEISRKNSVLAANLIAMRPGHRRGGGLPVLVISP
jgi:hypothetical protein